MNDQKISLEFSYTEAEYLSACRLALFSSPTILIRLVVLLIMVLAATLLLTVLVADFPFWVALGVTLLLEAALLYNILVRKPRHNFRGDGKFRDKYELTFSDQGVGVKTRQIDSKLAWSLYTKVIEGADQFLLVYGREIRTITVIPKRAFQNKSQENAFRELLSRHITEHSTLGRSKAPGETESEYKPTSLNPPDWR